MKRKNNTTISNVKWQVLVEYVIDNAKIKFIKHPDKEIFGYYIPLTIAKKYKISYLEIKLPHKKTSAEAQHDLLELLIKHGVELDLIKIETPEAETTFDLFELFVKNIR